MAEKEVKRIYPRCMGVGRTKNRMRPFGHSAKGFILPCCWCDVADPEYDPQIMKLMKPKLHLDNVEDMNDILLSDEWIEFYKSITTDYKNAPKCCKRHCGHTNSEKTEIYYKPK